MTCEDHRVVSKVFQLEHGAQLHVCDMRRAPNCFLLSIKKLPWQQYHSRQVQTAIALQWTFFCHESRTQRTWIGIACVLGETGCACAEGYQKRLR